MLKSAVNPSCTGNFEKSDKLKTSSIIFAMGNFFKRLKILRFRVDSDILGSGEKNCKRNG